MENTRNRLVIYHGGCTDGCAAAYVFSRYSEETRGWTYYAGAHGEPPPWDLVDRHDGVVLLDFSYPPELVHELSVRTGSRVVVIDHHENAVSRLRSLPSGTVEIHTGTRCGALLTWSYLYGNRKPPRILEHIGKIDTADPTRNATDEAIVQSVRSYPHWGAWNGLLDGIWHELMTRPVMDHLIDGEAILRRHRVIVREACANAMHWTFKLPAHHPDVILLGANATYSFASDTANALAEGAENGVAFAWFLRNDLKVQLSFRALRGVVRVDALAELLGGGGHAYAAGAEVPVAHFDFTKRVIDVS